MKTLLQTLVILTVAASISGCITKKDYFEVNYLREGKIEKMEIPLSFIEGKDKVASPYIEEVKFAVLDSISFEDNNPDKLRMHTTPVDLDFTKPVEQYSPEYYAIYSVYCLDKAGKYYNELFGDKIDFNSQEDYRSIEVAFGDIPLFTNPKGYIYEPGCNPSPSTLYHEMGHRAFWYIYDEESGLGIKFKGLTYIHMGLLEYFTVSLNDSPVVGEDMLPPLTIRDARADYRYPVNDSLNLEASYKKLKESYPEQFQNPQSNIRRYYDLAVVADKEYMHIGNNHETGMILTSTLWRIRGKLGRDLTDRLVAGTTLDLNRYLDTRDSFYTPSEGENLRDRIEWCDFYYGFIMKNRELNNGADEEFIIEQFSKTGFPTNNVVI